MSAFSKLIVLFAFALSATALTTPHVARGFQEHHALAARKAAPSPEPLAEVRVVRPRRLRRRGDSGRCSSTASSSSTSSTLSSSSTSSSSSALTSPSLTSSTSSADSTSSPAQIATAVVNVGATTSSSTSTPPPPPPSSTSDAAPASSPAFSNSGGGAAIFGSFFAGTNSGQGTFYSPGLGACGVTNSDSDMIAAAAFGLFDNVPGSNGNPNDNPVCGKQVIASSGGKSVTVTITDRCAGCEISGSLDFSPAAFNQLADPSVGRIPITWQWA